MNEIQDDPLHDKVNKITIYAGRKNQSREYRDNPSERGRYHWEASGAFVIPRMKGPHFEQADIGIVEIEDTPDKTQEFFDQYVLYRDFGSPDKEEIKNSRIIPICLASEHSDLSGKTLKGAGWGIEYQEKRENNPRNPEYSTCMTSELSYPRENRFQNCDMRKIQANNWECRTDHPPPGYQAEKCKVYAREARGTALRNKFRLKLSTKEFSDLFKIDIMYVKKRNGSSITCIGTDWNTGRYWEHGWCELPKSYPGEEFRWGICSPSCSRDLMRVK